MTEHSPEHTASSLRKMAEYDPLRRAVLTEAADHIDSLLASRPVVVEGDTAEEVWLLLLQWPSGQLAWKEFDSEAEAETDAAIFLRARPKLSRVVVYQAVTPELADNYAALAVPVVGDNTEADNAELRRQLAERDADDVQRSEDGRTDWDYGRKIARLEAELAKYFDPKTVAEIRQQLDEAEKPCVGIYDPTCRKCVNAAPVLVGDDTTETDRGICECGKHRTDGYNALSHDDWVAFTEWLATEKRRH